MDFIISLLEDLGMDLVKIGVDFIEHLDQFDKMEADTKARTDKLAAQYMERLLNHADALLCQSSIRKEEYDIQRHRTRTLITTAGDVTFNHTLFKDKETGKNLYLLDRKIKLLKGW